MYIVLYVISLYIICGLGKHCMPPIIAGAIGVLIGQQTQDIRYAVFMGLSLYITCFMSNTLPQVTGYSTGSEVLSELGSLNERNSAALYLYRAGGLIIFFLLPMPVAPIQIPWVISLPIATILLAFNNPDKNKIISQVIYVIIQTSALAACGYIATQLGWVINPVMGVILALAIPKLMFKRNPIRSQPDSNLNQLVAFPYITSLAALLTLWLTPGLSASIMTNSLFRRGATRSLSQGFLAGAVEGYVISLMARGLVSGKSTWGSILETPILDWGSFTPNIQVYLIIILSICIGITLPIVSNRFEDAPNQRYFKYYTMFFIGCQALTDVGYLLPMFLVVGISLYKLRVHWGVEEETCSLGIISVML